jgi:hypothetical protein
MREDIGVHMNDEILCCEVKVFQNSYLPEPQLSEEEYTIVYDAGLASVKSGFSLKKNQSMTYHSEAELSRLLQEVVEALLEALTDGDGRRTLCFNSEPNKAVISGIVGGNFKMDASLNNAAGSLHTTNIVVAMEFKLHRNFDTVRKASALIHSRRSSVAKSPHRIAYSSHRRLFIF